MKRYLPNTDNKRQKALDRAKYKKDNTPVADLALTTGTIVRLDDMQPLYAAQLVLRGNAKSAMTSLTAEKDAKSRIAGLYVSHFIQELTNAIIREVPGFSVSDRSFYQLPENSFAISCTKNAKRFFMQAKGPSIV